MKYDWLLKKDMRNIYVIVICFFLCVWGVIAGTTSYYYRKQYNRTISENEYIVGKAERRIDDLRTRLTELETREQTIKLITTTAIESTERTDEILDRDIKTVAEMRAVLQDLQRVCNSYEQCIFDINANIGNKGD